MLIFPHHSHHYLLHILHSNFKLYLYGRNDRSLDTLAHHYCLLNYFFYFCLPHFGRVSHDLISLITAGSSIGGILATGCGFAFPTFISLIKSSLKNGLLLLGILSLSWLCSPSARALWDCSSPNAFEHKLLNVDKLPFPIRGAQL